jgi:hypothetical protein
VARAALSDSDDLQRSARLAKRSMTAATHGRLRAVKRLALLAAAIAVCAGAVCVQSASAAPAPLALGQNPLAEGPVGGCECSAVQLADSGTSSYAIPFSGVLTKTRVWVGHNIEAQDWTQARTFRTSGPADATVISEGTKHFLTGLSPGVANTFEERIPATAGDVLGARFHDSAFIEETPARFPSASSSDLIGVGPFSAEPGSTFTSSFTATSWRVNMMATLEPDEDGDGYGDGSQDLCPGSPIATTACSGTLFGSGLIGLHGQFTGCGFACLYIQKSIEGHPTAAPIDGVVVRWRLLGASTGTYHVRVIAPTGSNEYKILHSSDAGTVTSEPQLTERISTFETRLPIPAGGYVALATPVSPQLGFRSGGGSYEDINDHVADGSVVPATGTTTGQFLYDADIEPDADHDGYGDVTQDACASDASTQGACPPVVIEPPKPTSKKPAISDFKAKPTSFRIKPGGAVVSRRHPAHAGTTLSLTLSEAASVAFSVERHVPCKPGAKKVKHCPRWVAIHSFKRTLKKGKGSVAYSGRYKAGGKVQSLPPGPYRVTAVPTSEAGISGNPARTALTVVPWLELDAS